MVLVHGSLITLSTLTVGGGGCKSIFRSVTDWDSHTQLSWIDLSQILISLILIQNRTRSIYYDVTAIKIVLFILDVLFYFFNGSPI